MEKEQKKPKKQAKMPAQRIQNIVLSENRSAAKYKIIKIQQNAVIRKEKADTASASAQSQKQADKKPEDMQKAVNMSGKSQRRNTFASSSNKTTTPEENSGDKYKDLAKINLAKKSETNDNTAINKRAEDTNYRVQNASIVQAIQRKSNNENEVKSYTSNNTQDMAKTSRYKAKAEEITAKMKADVNKMRSETSSLENGIKSFAIGKAKDGKKIVHFKKGNVDSKRFNKAVNNTIKKEISNNPDYKKCKGKAAVHYKKMNKLEKKQKKIDNKLEKAERKAERNEKILEAGKTAAAVLTNPKQAVKQFAEDKIRKTALGNSALNAKDDLQMLSKAAEADSLSEGTANVVMAMPEKYIKNSVKNTVTKTLTGRSKAERLAKKKKKVDRKYGAEAAKAGRAERKALQAKNSVIRKAKIRFFKEEKGLAKSQNIIKNIKNGIGRAIAGVGKLALECGKSAMAAIIGSVGPIVILFLIIIVVIAALFSWLNPHMETLYFQDTNTWEDVMVTTNDEILKGYLKHIQDYFDKRQLEILKKVDYEFGGFEPDCYEWEHTEENPNAITEEPEKLIEAETKGYYVNVRKTEYTITGMTEGGRDNMPKPIWSSEPTVTTTNHADVHTDKGGWDESWRVMHDEYYKIDEKGGYEVRTTAEDYDYIATYIDYSVDVAGFWNSVEDIKTEKGLNFDKWGNPIINVYTAEVISGDVITDKTDVLNRGALGRVGRDITGYTLRLYKNSDKIYDGDYAAYLKSHPELFMHVEGVSVSGYFQIYSSDESMQIANGLIRPPTYELSYTTRNRTNIMEDLQYVPDKHIWNLNEYGNRWIKLSDDCDFEHIIALAAVKKWQEINSPDFDSNTYEFEITDEDLDFCLDNLYNFSYGYTTGRCMYDNCHKDGDPPHTYCNRATTHKHLIGQVANLEVAGGIDYILNKVLTIPVQSNFTSQEEYQKALNEFETCKDIYDVYVEFLYDTLGTSTKISDYENDNAAQYRLLKMYQAEYGKKPSNPPKNIKIISHKKQAAPITPSEAATSPGATKYEHYYISLKWDAPEPEYISEDKTVEITQYDIYELDRSSGEKKKLATVSADNLAAYDIDVGSGPYKGIDGDTIRVNARQITIVMQSVNEAGSSPNSKHVTYWLQ